MKNSINLVDTTNLDVDCDIHIYDYDCSGTNQYCTTQILYSLCLLKHSSSTMQ